MAVVCVRVHTQLSHTHTTGGPLTRSRAHLLRQSVDGQVGSPCQQDVHEAYTTTAPRVQKPAPRVQAIALRG